MTLWHGPLKQFDPDPHQVVQALLNYLGIEISDEEKEES